MTAVWMALSVLGVCALSWAGLRAGLWAALRIVEWLIWRNERSE